MIEFGGVKCGWPWGGLYRRSTDKITTPAGGDIERPTGSVWPFNGDCHLIQLPGLPEPITTPAEAASGQTWRNYGLISGGTIYGQALGGNVYLYIDPQGDAWSFLLPFSGSRTGGQFSVEVWARRFGRVMPASTPGEAPSQRWSGSVGFSINSAGPADVNTDAGFHVLDVAKNGRRVLFGGWRYYSGIGMDSLSPRRYYAIAELVIDGTPGVDLDCSITLLADESSEVWDTLGTLVDEHPWIGASWVASPVTPTSAPPAYADRLPETLSDWDGFEAGAVWSEQDQGWFAGLEVTPVWGADRDALYATSFGMVPDSSAEEGNGPVFSWRKEWIAGARYEGGLPKVIRCVDVRRTHGTTGSLLTLPGPVTIPVSSWNTPNGALAVSYSLTWAIDHSLQVFSGGALIDERIFDSQGEATVTRVFRGDKTATAEITTQANGATNSYMIDYGPAYSQVAQAWYASTVDGVSVALLTGHCRRLSNAVYTTHSTAYDHSYRGKYVGGVNQPSPVQGFIIGPAIGAIGRDDQIHVYPDRRTTGLPDRATEHPITGQVVRDSSVVCWV